MKSCRIPFIAAAVIALLTTVMRADVTLPRILGDNLVLQRDGPVPVWGRAAGVGSLSRNT